MGPQRIAGIFHKLMTETLGYQRYGAQGGDWGSVITTSLARMFPDTLIGAHINMMAGRLPPRDDATDEEKAVAERMAWWTQEEAGYQRIQGTKPQTLGYALNDSPAGLLAWIVEKWRSWSDCDGDVEKSFTRDEILTNVTIYWVTQTINSSMRLYYESGHAPRAATPIAQRSEVPIGVADFPKEIYRASRRQAEALFNLTHWTTMPRGGHFAALEEPELLVDDVRSFFRTLR
jgi:microsomal epoxide hydrolase